MEITLKLFATLTRFLPPGAQDHVAKIEVDDGASPLDVLESYGVPLPDVHLVFINGVFVHQSDRNKAVKEGDELAVWPPIAGG